MGHNKNILIGILSLQGAIKEHILALQSLNISSRIIKNIKDLDGLNGLIIPGGESTAIKDLLKKADLLNKLQKLIHNGFPIFGTCAGMVLLAQKDGLNSLDAKVIRNGFGRQQQSFEENLNFRGFKKPFPGIFIRAPYLINTAPDIEILSRVNNKIVAVKKSNILATAFHPELTSDNRIHDYFIQHFVKKSTLTKSKN